MATTQPDNTKIMTPNFDCAFFSRSHRNMITTDALIFTTDALIFVNFNFHVRMT